MKNERKRPQVVTMGMQLLLQICPTWQQMQRNKKKIEQGNVARSPLYWVPFFRWQNKAVEWLPVLYPLHADQLS